jgi:hypothetical protein
MDFVDINVKAYFFVNIISFSSTEGGLHCSKSNTFLITKYKYFINQITRAFQSASLFSLRSSRRLFLETVSLCFYDIRVLRGNFS